MSGTSSSVNPEEECVRVVVRLRPPNNRELQGYVKFASVNPCSKSLTVTGQPQPKAFTFDYVADEEVDQRGIFLAVGKSISDACLEGYNCCLLAYGQTGAGKTFTMEGIDTLETLSTQAQENSLTMGNDRRGLIPRILHYIFDTLKANHDQDQANESFTVKCSYLEIYNEQVQDLLNPYSKNLSIREDAGRGVFVEDLLEVVVQSAEATYNVFKYGSQNRNVGATVMNSESSRSHSVFTLVVESQRNDPSGQVNRRKSRFYLVDLAGSERQKQTEAAGVRLKEANSINKSLSALGNVIKALVDCAEGKSRHVPYRDSKLTYLLKDALGGNSKCTLIANISPAEKNAEESMSTLKFAQRAKLIHNNASVNEDALQDPAQLALQVKKLRAQLVELKGQAMNGKPGWLTAGLSGEPSKFMSCTANETEKELLLKELQVAKNRKQEANIEYERLLSMLSPNSKKVKDASEGWKILLHDCETRSKSYKELLEEAQGFLKSKLHDIVAKLGGPNAFLQAVDQQGVFTSDVEQEKARKYILRLCCP